MIVFDRSRADPRTDGDANSSGRRRWPVARPADQRGMALIAVLLLMLVSLAIGLLSANSSRTERAIAHNQVLELRALAVAEAGINMLKKQIESHYGVVNSELALNGGCACATSTCNYGVGASGSGLEAIGSLANVTLPGDAIAPRCYRFAAFGGGASDGYYVRVEDNLDEPTGTDQPLVDVDETIRVISHGVIGTAERTIVATFHVTPGTPGGPGLFGKNSVQFDGGGGYADSYTMVGGVPQYAHDAVIRSNVIIDMGSSTVVYGDEISGGTVAGNPPVDGTITLGAPLLNFPAVAACGPPFSGTSGIHFAGSGTYDTSNGKLVCGSSCGNVTFDPGTYCFGLVTLSGGATLTVTGPTVINVTDKFVAGGGAVVNTTMDPAQFQLNSSYVGKNAVSMTGGSGSFIQINVPGGDVVVGGGGDLFGSIIAANIDFTGGSRYHQNGSGGGTPGVVNVSSWHEVEY